jgi:hypothetical protein
MCDAHVVKMIVESCQILSTVNHLRGNPIGYKPTHINHPCVKAVSNNIHNEKWLLNHCRSLINEYHYRYGKVHASVPVLEKLSKMVPDDNWNEQSLSFPKCMDDDCKVGGDDLDSVVNSYRNYYNSKKKTMFRFTYKKRNVPEFIRV